MTRYAYILSQGGRESRDAGDARSDAEAREEAVRFFSEVLREARPTDGETRLRLTVLDGERLVCAIDTVVRCAPLEAG